MCSNTTFWVLYANKSYFVKIQGPVVDSILPQTTPFQKTIGTNTWLTKMTGDAPPISCLVLNLWILAGNQELEIFDFFASDNNSNLNACCENCKSLLQILRLLDFPMVVSLNCRKWSYSSADQGSDLKQNQLIQCSWGLFKGSELHGVWGMRPPTACFYSTDCDWVLEWCSLSFNPAQRVFLNLHLLPISPGFSCIFISHFPQHISWLPPHWLPRPECIEVWSVAIYYDAKFCTWRSTGPPVTITSFSCANLEL